MRRTAHLGIAALVLTARSALAEPSPADRALATALFEEGRALIAAGKAAQACEKFAESQRLDPGAGTLLNLANCHEAEGRTATAWSEFHAALAVAEREGQADRVAFARAHIDALTPVLPKVTLVVRPELSDVDLEIARDGTIVARVVTESAMPLDPGSHRIDVKARGYAPWSVVFDIASGERREIVIGPLVPAAEETPAEVHDAPETRPANVSNEANAPRATSSQKTIGLAVGGAGLVGLAIGTVAGIVALRKTSESESLCVRRCNDEGYALNQEAKTAADISTVSFIVGAVALGAGVVLVLTSPKADPKTAFRRPVLTYFW